jgi:hypothetical protein
MSFSSASYSPVLPRWRFPPAHPSQSKKSMPIRRENPQRHQRPTMLSRSRPRVRTSGSTHAEHPGQLANETRQLLTDYLVSEIGKTLGPAKLVSSPAAAGRSGWLVTGDITRINEGSRILRMAIGLGAGGTKLETRVRVINLPASNPPFLSFHTTGGSGAEPGAATTRFPSPRLQPRCSPQDGNYGRCCSNFTNDYGSDRRLPGSSEAGSRQTR